MRAELSGANHTAVASTFGRSQDVGVREGDVLGGKYRVERILGVGGMGTVVAAHRMDLDQWVAIKFLLPEMLTNSDVVARFAREARAAVKITGEHVARVFDVGTLETGAPYIVMEYLDGIDLGTWIQQRGALPIAQAADFLIQACVAIAEAHGLGIVHRDIKPSNLFCIRGADGQLAIKVLDFGIAKIPSFNSAGPGIVTKTTAIIGSPLYMSPEQTQSARDVDARADIWALGIVLYELLAGRVPFAGETMGEIIVKIATQTPEPIRNFRPDLPDGLEAVFRKCTEKDRERRYQNVGELGLALLPFAPRSSKAAVDKIARIVESAGFSGESFSGSPSPGAAQTQPTTQTGLGSTARPPVKSRAKAVVLALGSIAVIAIASFVWHMPAPRQASAPSAPYGSPTVPVTTAPSVATKEVSLPTDPEVLPPSTTALEAGSEASGAAARGASTSIGQQKTTSTSPQPPANPIPRPAAPVCTVVATYDSEGEPHFKKVCK
jgi:serine/threonine protein kinase